MKKINNCSIRFNYLKKQDIIKMTAGRGWGFYLENSVSLFMSAFNKIRKNINNDFVMNISLSDKIEELPEDEYYYGFSTANPDNMNRLIPAPFFINWADCKINDYDEACKEIYQEGLKEPQYETCFWSGNINTHKSRKLLYETYKNNKHFTLNSMDWIGNGVGLAGKPTSYISMKEQTKYKYLLDIRGNSWSGRIPFLLFTNRPLFYVEREPIAYFEKDLKPFVHYIPVKSNLTDLDEKYIWAQEHYDQAKQIAKNALEYAQKHLTRANAIDYYSKKILECAYGGEVPVFIKKENSSFFRKFLSKIKNKFY